MASLLIFVQFLLVATCLVLPAVEAQASCAQSGQCTVPSSCDAAANAVPWAPCSSRNWAEGIPGGRSTAAPTVDAAFTACNAPRAMRRCAAVYDQCRPNGTDAGVTVPGGYDAAFLSAADIDALPTAAASSATKASLHAYAGLQGAAAVAAVCGAPLTLATQAEAQALYDGLLARRAAVVAAAYDAQRAAGVPAFAQLGRCYRTALVDVFWDRALPGGAPAVWAAAVAGDWLTGTQAVYALARDDVGQFERYQRLGRVLEVCRQSCDVDMIILLDESGSVGAANFVTAKNAAKAIIDGFSDLSQKGTRVGVASYDDGYSLKWGLDRYGTQAQYNAAIDGIPYGSGGTRTGNAITKGTASLLATARPASDIVPRAMIVITDGQSGDSVDGPSAAARAAGITTFGVGVAGFVLSQIESIAGSPDRAFTASSFSDLITLAGRVGGSQCLSSAEIPSGSTVTNDPGQSRYMRLPVPACGTGESRVRLTLTLVSGSAVVYYSLVHATPNAGNADGSVELNATRREAALELVGRAGAGTAYLGMVSPDGSVVTITAEECPPTATPELTETQRVTATIAVTKSPGITTSADATATDSVHATPSYLPSATGTAPQTSSNPSTATRSTTASAEITDTVAASPSVSTHPTATNGATHTATVSATALQSPTATTAITASLSRPPSLSSTLAPTGTQQITLSATIPATPSLPRSKTIGTHSGSRSATATATGTAELPMTPSSTLHQTVTTTASVTASRPPTPTPLASATFTKAASASDAAHLASKTRSATGTTTRTAVLSTSASATHGRTESGSLPLTATEPRTPTAQTTVTATVKGTPSSSATLTIDPHSLRAAAPDPGFLASPAGSATLGVLAVVVALAVIAAGLFVARRRLRVAFKHRTEDDINFNDAGRWTQRFDHKGDADIQMVAERALEDEAADMVAARMVMDAADAGTAPYHTFRSGSPAAAATAVCVAAATTDASPGVPLQEEQVYEASLDDFEELLEGTGREYHTFDDEVEEFDIAPSPQHRPSGPAVHPSDLVDDVELDLAEFLADDTATDNYLRAINDSAL